MIISIISPAMVTMGAEDLVASAEDLYGDGPGMICIAIISDIKLLYKLTTARFGLECPDWLGLPLYRHRRV